MAYEYNRKLEGLVCHDSGIGGVPFLADKELRFLIYELSKKGCDIITVFDCCHSGDNTRLNPLGLTERKWDDINQIRDWEEFLFHEEIKQEDVENARSLDDVMPQGKHIQIAACQDYESAYEHPRDEYGYFTKAFLNTLVALQGDVSYIELQRRIQQQIQLKFRINSQHPQIYAPRAYREELFKSFLFGKDFDQPFVANIGYRLAKKSWRMDLGGIHGIKKHNPEAKIEGADSSVVVIDLGNDKTVRATVEEVFTTHSVLSFKPYENISRNAMSLYQGSVSGVLLYPTYMIIEANPSKATAKEFKKALLNKRGELKNDNIFLLDRPEERKDQRYECYRMLVGNENNRGEEEIVFTLAGSDIPLVKQIPLDQKAEIEAIKVMKAFSQWHFAKKLENPGQDFIKNPLDLTVYQNKTQIPFKNDQQSMPLNYYQDEKDKIDYKFKFTNRSGMDLHVACLYLGSLYEIEVDYFQPSVAKLSNGDSLFALNGGSISLPLPSYIEALGWPGETVYLKIIASKEPFETDIFYQIGQEAPDAETITRSTEKSSNRKGGLIFPEIPPSLGEWTTQLFEFNIRMPQ